MKADKDNNKVVDLDELIHYLEENVPRQAEKVVTRALAKGGAVAKGTNSGESLQKPTSSSHRLGFVPLATPIRE